ncbi:MAG: polysaccharide deacetylase family protein [bacterium]|nr:polysaccharide deacetylase family protein [bacterium]
MSKKSIYILLIIAFCVTPLTGQKESRESFKSLKRKLIIKYSGKEPKEFSPWLPGIKRGIRTKEKIIALTFDACGGHSGDRFDKKLVDFLIKNNIPTTIFVSGKWINSNRKSFMELVGNPLFEIENHGLVHRPCSVADFSKFGIDGTGGVAKVIDEIELNARKIAHITGRRPIFFRPGTTYFDDIAVKIVYDLKHTPINYNCPSGDTEKDMTPHKIAQKVLRSAKNGSIVIMHMNHPQRSTRKALEITIPLLKQRGYRFVKLRDYKKQLY